MIFHALSLIGLLNRERTQRVFLFFGLNPLSILNLWLRPMLLVELMFIKYLRNINFWLDLKWHKGVIFLFQDCKYWNFREISFKIIVIIIFNFAFIVTWIAPSRCFFNLLSQLLIFLGNKVPLHTEIIGKQIARFLIRDFFYKTSPRKIL